MKNNRDAGKKILVIDAIIPRPDQDSGSFRMYNFLQLLTSLSEQVTFAAYNLESPQPYASRLETVGIKVLTKSAVNSIEEHLQQDGSLYDVVILSRVPVAVRYIRQVRQYAPQALILFDTVDLHFVREYRGARVTGNMNLLKRAMRTKSQELAVAREADWTLVVSPTEKATLEKECPGVKVQIISNIHQTHKPVTPFARRKDILFIGSFDHHPNVDAMLYFADEIYPRLREKMAGVKIYIIGGNPPESVQNLNSDEMIVTDYVPDVTPYFNQCKLSIAPLRYGAGVKGKVHLSMSYGLPVVASSIAVEGMSLTDRQQCTIADDPVTFCEAIAKVYHDKKVWERLSEDGLNLISNHFSFEAARSNLIELLGDNNGGELWNT